MKKFEELMSVSKEIENITAEDAKKKINDLRDTLVGKVPDPKSQVEQIMIALIYKFMNDMDEQSVSLGGKSTFFAGKFEKYSWKNLILNLHRMVKYPSKMEEATHHQM